MGWECPCKISERAAAFLAGQPEAPRGAWEISPVLARAKLAGIPGREFLEHLCAAQRARVQERERLGDWSCNIWSHCRTEQRIHLMEVEDRARFLDAVKTGMAGTHARLGIP